jgi:hypothetical protein
MKGKLLKHIYEWKNNAHISKGPHLGPLKKGQNKNVEIRCRTKMPNAGEESLRVDANETGGLRDNGSHAGSTTEPEV